uniref:Uncharacterized protein n=1 Tax=Timema tahoe TaxID=61484 RepID=A0A7R9IKD2_9NEOP|nr:unnamed protein product [Timema tahoe]
MQFVYFTDVIDVVHSSKKVRLGKLTEVIGKHRPLWPKYGEYRFVPRQRWLHNLEHGGIVLLYHPCVNPLALDRLKSMVTNCIRKHVITPFTLLDEERPFALLAWGCRLTMSVPSYAVVKDFIMKHALRGPEMLDTEGQYDLELMVPAGKVSRMAFDELCPYD